MWGTTIFLLAILTLFFNAKPITIGLFATALLYFGGGKLLESAFARLHVTRPSPRTYVFPTEKATITLSFQNPGYIPLAWIAGTDRLPMQLAGKTTQRWLTSLPPKSSVDVSYEVQPTRRGIYTVGPVEMEVGDPLGLHRRTGTSQSFCDIVVYPELVPIDQLGLPSNLAVGNVRGDIRIYPDPSRLAGVRHYQQGDPKKWVHWKATARTGELHVKEFEHAVTLDSFILLNFNERDYKKGVRWHDIELAITTAAALAQYVTSLGDPLGFITNAHLRYYGTIQPVRTQRSDLDRIIRVMPRKGTTQLMRILEILAAAHCEPAANFVAMMNQEARHFSWGATLLIVTPADSKELIDTCLLLVASGYRPVLLVTGDTLVHPDLTQNSRGGIRMYHVRRGRDTPLALQGGARVG